MQASFRMAIPSCRPAGKRPATTALAALALLASSPARAQTTWTGANSTDWLDPGNWSAGVPHGGVNAIIDIVTPPAVVDGGAADVATARVGITGTGRLTVQNAGSLDATGLQAGAGAGADGTITIQGGGDVTASAGVIAGNALGAHGTITITGAGSTLTTGGSLTVGNFGIGRLTVSDGADVVASIQGIFGANGPGTAIVTGSGSTLTTGGSLLVGVVSTGALTIAAGAVVSSGGGGIGQGGGSRCSPPSPSCTCAAACCSPPSSTASSAAGPRATPR